MVLRHHIFFRDLIGLRYHRNDIKSWLKEKAGPVFISSVGLLEFLTHKMFIKNNAV